MSENRATTVPHRIAVLLVSPVVGFDATIPPLLFGQACDEDGRSLYEVTTVSISPGPVATTTAYQLIAAAGPEAIATADTVIVPGTRDENCRRRASMPDGVAAALARIRPDARIVSICTGAFLLAAAGFLDGRRATTHWRYADDFRRLYPDVALDESVLYVDEGQILSSAGLAAGIDLCLHIIRRDHGAAVANRVARHCVVPPWREGGQGQFIERGIPGDTGHLTQATREWALTHLDEALSVERLAAHAHLSVRTFIRRFREETGTAPGSWLRDRRVDLARELLETTGASIDEIAERSGLGSADNLRHHLRNELGMAPSAYRKTFRGA
ncbi:helix-turn-helix domain-containing protein [Gordonia sp. L191]|uniref:GlxA family transcriptional regulator n=1 Tax=Gordonia sp. L191 TaxID=2982699 RepID=UPI0024C03E0E|nr:helix-turn-helix domain-containing protein [Gordonia sp. L191]WHU48794.1 helix-turn-helix domain-containing protein [Gordonia sp. L191]